MFVKKMVMKKIVRWKYVRGKRRFKSNDFVENLLKHFKKEDPEESFRQKDG
jgi:hypothetical protein